VINGCIAKLSIMSGRKPLSPQSPGTWALGAALDQSQALTRLLQRLQESQARFADIRELLPDPLRGAVRPGPLDDAGWSLLAHSGAVASKLRQMVPELDAALLARGWQATPIRIKVQSN
jgi:hypothetical protein